MSDSKIAVYYHRCSVCGKVIASLSRVQAAWNAQQHYLLHKVVLELREVEVRRLVVDAP